MSKPVKPLTWDQRVAEARKMQGTNKDYGFAERLASVGGDETRYNAARAKDVEMAQQGWYAVTGEGSPLGSRTQVVDLAANYSSNNPHSGSSNSSERFTRMYYQKPEQKGPSAEQMAAAVAAKKKAAPAAAQAPAFDFSRYAKDDGTGSGETTRAAGAPSFLAKYLGQGYQATQVDGRAGLYEDYLSRKRQEQAPQAASAQPTSFMGRYVASQAAAQDRQPQAAPATAAAPAASGGDWGAAGQDQGQERGRYSYDTTQHWQDAYEREKQKRSRFAGGSDFRAQLGASLASPLTT